MSEFDFDYKLPNGLVISVTAELAHDRFGASFWKLGFSLPAVEIPAYLFASVLAELPRIETQASTLWADRRAEQRRSAS